MQPKLFLEKYAPRPCNPSFFSRNTRPSHATQAFSREIRAPAMQPRLFLEKYAPQPCNPSFFSRNAPPGGPKRPPHASCSKWQRLSKSSNLKLCEKCWAIFWGFSRNRIPQFSRNTRPSSAAQAFSRGIRAAPMQPKLFLEKYAAHATQAFSREIRAPAMQPKLFLEKCASGGS